MLITPQTRHKGPIPNVRITGFITGIHIQATIAGDYQTLVRETARPPEGQPIDPMSPFRWIPVFQHPEEREAIAYAELIRLGHVKIGEVAR